MDRKFINWGILILITGLGFEAFANRVSEADYSFPKQAGLLSSLYGACYYGGETKSSKFEVNLRNRRLENYRNFRKLPVAFYPPDTPTDRIVYIISGIGGDEKSCNSKYLATMIQKAGFAAVILPNTFTTSFVVAISRTGLVGIPAVDAMDMGEAMTLIEKSLTDVGWRFSSSSIIGYSHGAVTASFLSQSPYSASLRIKSVLLINPPLDLLPNIRLIDSWKAEFEEIGTRRLMHIGPPTKKLFKSCSKKITSSEAYVSFNSEFKSLGLSASETRGVVGKTLSDPMKDVILAGQDIEDREILPSPGYDSPVGRIQQRARERAAQQFTMEKYVRKILLPYGVPGGRKLTIEQLNQEASLYGILPKLKSDPRIFVMHNEDDFILHKGDADLIEDHFGSHARLYPAGGHMGNLWHTDNQNAVRNWLLENRIN